MNINRIKIIQAFSKGVVRGGVMLLIIFISALTSAQSKHGKTTKYPSYKGLVMAGYQGGFEPRKMEPAMAGYIMARPENSILITIPLISGPM